MTAYLYERFAGSVRQYELLTQIANYLVSMFDMDPWCAFMYIMGAMYEFLAERAVYFRDLSEYTLRMRNDAFIDFSRKIIDRAGLQKYDHDIFIDMIGIYQKWNNQEQASQKDIFLRR